MAEDSNYGGSKIGFTANLGSAQPSAVSSIFNRFNLAQREENDRPHLRLPLKAATGLALAASIFALAASPEEAGKTAGEIKAGFDAGMAQAELCRQDCSPARIAGEEAGKWFEKFSKGYKNGMTR